MRTLAFACLIAVATSLPAQYDANAPTPIPRLRGTFIVGGGGELAATVYDGFVAMAGGEEARVVLLGASPPTAAERARFESRGVKAAKLTALHTATPDAARADGFVAPLRAATGAWITGSDPAAFVAAYRGTPVEPALRDIVGRGGVVGGNGAVTRAMTRTMITNGDTKATVGSGLDLIPGAVIDDHYTGKKRRERLLGVLDARRSLVGIGVDAGTAMILHQRWIDVLGTGSVYGCVLGSAKRKLRVERINRNESPASQRRRPATTRRRGEARRGRRRAARAYRPRKLADLMALSRSAQARAYPKFPAYSPEPPDVKKGTLIIVGGGGLPPGLMEKFIALAGGPDAPLVYIPCEEQERIESAPRLLDSWRRAGAKDVDWVHTKSRRAADTDEELLNKLRRAKGIWFGGGRQWNLVDSYQNTTAHKLMHDVLARGGVIGGSSAGASIQGSYMARGNPLGNRDSMAEGYEIGLGFLTGVAIDQHFTQRNRLPDMTALVDTYPELLGIGLDEASSIIVRGTVAEVFSRPDRNALFYDRRIPVVAGKLDHVVIKHGQRYDLKARRLVDPGPKKR